LPLINNYRKGRPNHLLLKVNAAAVNHAHADFVSDEKDIAVLLVSKVLLLYPAVEKEFVGETLATLAAFD